MSPTGTGHARGVVLDVVLLSVALSVAPFPPSSSDTFVASTCAVSRALAIFAFCSLVGIVIPRLSARSLKSSLSFVNLSISS